MRGLPLLELLAKGAGGTASLEYLAPLQLVVRVEPPAA